MLDCGKSRFAKRGCSERREVSEEDANRAVVRRWIETFNNPYTPQTEVDALAPGYIAHAPGLPGPLDLEAWTQFTASFVEAFPDLRLTVEDIFSGGNMVAARVAFRGGQRHLICRLFTQPRKRRGSLGSSACGCGAS